MGLGAWVRRLLVFPIQDTPLGCPLHHSVDFSSEGRVYILCTQCSQVLGVNVCFVMLGQVVAPHEPFLTLVALEALVSYDKIQKRIGCK